MKNIKLYLMCLSLSILGITLTAQEKENKEIVKGEMRVKVIKNDNGNIEEFDETFSIEDEEKLQELLKEHGVEMPNDLQEEMHKHKNYQIDSKAMSPANGVMKVRVIKRGDGKMEEIDKEFSFEEKEEIHEMLKEYGVEVDESGNDVEKKVRVYKLQSASNIESVEMDDDFFKAIKEAAEEGDAEKIMEMVSSKKDWHALNGGKAKKIVVSYELSSSDAENALMFYRKKNENKPEEEIPTTINQSFDNNSSIEKLKLFPNPVNDHFNMNFISKEAQDYQLTITDSKGSKIFERQLTNFKGTFNEDFDLTKYDKGLYFFNLISKDKTISKKIIVL